MNFDADRLAALAGLGASGSKSLNEASNRTQHDEKYYQDEVSWRVGKNQLSEGEHEGSGMAGSGEHLPMDEDEHADVKEMADMEEMEDMEEMMGDDVVLEIDETMLKNEIRKMKRQRVHENNLRMAIRNEIQGIFGELGVEKSNDWVYGKNKPVNSKEGEVVTAFPGIGFMK